MIGYQRLLTLTRGWRSNASSSISTSIQRPTTVKESIQRLNDSFNQHQPSLARTADSDAQEVMNDLKALHEQHLVIPNHFFAHGFRLAASAKKPEIFHELTKLAIDNQAEVSKEALKQTLTTGVKQAIRASLYSDALTIWEEARRTIPVTHVDTKNIVGFISESKVRFEKEDFMKQVLSTQEFHSFESLYSAYFRQSGALLYSHVHDVCTEENRQVDRRNDLLSSSTELLLRLLSYKTDASKKEREKMLVSVRFRGRVRTHIRILSQTGRYAEALRCLDALFSCFLMKEYVPSLAPNIGDILNHISSVDVPKLDNYRYADSGEYGTHGEMWAVDLLLLALHTSGDAFVWEKRSISRANIWREHLQYTVDAIHLADSYKLSTDRRIVNAFLESVHRRILNAEIEETNYDQEQEVLSPIVRSLQGYLENIPQLSNQQELLQSLAKVLITKPDTLTMNAAIHVLDWCIIRFPIFPSTISAVCKAASEYYKPTRLNLLDNRVKEWTNLHKAEYGTDGARIAMFPGLFALQKAMNKPVEMLALLHTQLKLRYAVPKHFFIQTLDEFCYTTSRHVWVSEQMKRFYLQIVPIVDWLHHHMVHRSGFTATQALYELIPLFAKAVVIYSANAEFVQTITERFEKWLQLHWLTPSKQSWTHEDELILKRILEFYIDQEHFDIAQKKLFEFRDRFGEDKVITATTLEPIIRQFVRVNGDLRSGEAMVTQYLINHNKPLSREIIDILIFGMMEHGDGKDALDLAQELYYQHRIQPSVATISILYHIASRRMDEFEAKRVYDFMAMLFGNEVADEAKNTFTRQFFLKPRKEREEELRREREEAKDDVPISFSLW